MWREFSQEELLDQYMPSRSVVRQLEFDPITHFTKVAQSKSEENRSSLPCTLGIPYVDQEADGGGEAKFDWFPPAASSAHKSRIFLFIHGGSWQRFSLSISSSFAGPVTQAGYTFVSLGYDLANPEKSIDIFFIVKQLRQGIKSIIRRAETEGIHNMIMTGHSAGAHLAAMILANVKIDSNEKDDKLLTEVELNFIDKAILFDGLYDIRPLAYIQEANKNLQLTESSAETLSPMFYANHIAKRNIRILIITGEHSSKEFQRQNREFSNTINTGAKNIICQFHREEEADHFSMIEYLDNKEFHLWSVIDEFLKQAN